MSRFAKIMFALLILAPLFTSAGQVFAQNNNTSLPKDSRFIPQCALDNPTGTATDEKECRSISIFVILLLHFSNYLFGVVGALALLFFIYGGFTLILSRGSTESVKKGKDILVAAVIGLVIVFGAYMLVRFLGEAIGLKDYYKLNPPAEVMGCCSNSDTGGTVQTLESNCSSSANNHRTWVPGPC